MVSASRFIKHRRTPNALTQKRVISILDYVIWCYLKMKSENVKYSKSYVAKTTKIKFEDYLKNRLVDDYLIKYKTKYSDNFSPIEELIFTYETNKEYKDSNEKLRMDKIDICILNTGLQDVWKGSNSNDVYYSIECKIIHQLSDTKKYLSDIHKFCSRKHTYFRLPFEGMIAFIESNKLTHSQIATKINSLLEIDTEIKTLKQVEVLTINKLYTGSYGSEHLKNYINGGSFSIHHLLFDFSDMIIN